MQSQRCYICGETLIPVPKGHNGPFLPKHCTSDHVPPKGIFDDPKPSNLITVLCCRECNGRHSGFDERLRMFAALEIGRNPGGENILTKKVFGSTMAKLRQREFVTSIAQTLRHEVVERPSGLESVAVFTISADLIYPGVINIVKGLLTHFYPRYDYSDDDFAVCDIHEATLAKGDAERQTMIINEMVTKTVSDTRGNNNEFRFWRHVESESGAWLLAFYEGVLFSVLHGKAELMERFKRP